VTDPELLTWIERGQLAAALLVAIGVAGEFAGSFIARPINRRIEAARQTEIAQATAKSEEARKVIAGADARIAEAEARAAEANQIAEQERLARLKIEQRLADRSLSDEQVTAIAAAVRPFAGQEVEIVPYSQNKESVSIANRILAAVTLGGWKFLKPTKWVGLMGGIIGVFVNVHPESSVRTRQAAAALVAALKEQGLVAEPKDKNNPDHPDNIITLTVGSKL